MDVLKFPLIAVLGYLLGSLNVSVLLSQGMSEGDVRSHGSGNAGLTNFYRTYGAKLVLAVVAIDMLKAVLAVELGGWVLGGALGKYFMGFFCMLGHMFPAPYRFRGGKGILSSGTLLLCLDWRVALVSWGAFLILVLLTRYVSLSPRRCCCPCPPFSSTAASRPLRGSCSLPC